MALKEFKISRLFSGGLITNYYCTSRCGHWLYASSPQFNLFKKFLTDEIDATIFIKDDIMVSLCENL